MTSEKSLWAVLMVLTLLVLTAARARPQDFDDEDGQGHADDRKDDPGRVQIKVYRGPSTHDGYAPWGFWVKQPSDEQ